MRSNYISDVYEKLSTPHDPSEPEMIALRADSKALATLAAVTIALLTLLALGLLLWPQRARAQEPFVLPQPACYFNNLDYRYLLADGADGIVWWCDTPEGMEGNSRTGEVGGLKEFLFRIGGAGRNLWLADQQIFVREQSAAEDAVVKRIEDAGEPRCFAQGTGKSQQVYTRNTDGTLGPAQVDAAGKVVYMLSGERVTCWDWITAGSKRYCLVTGNQDNKQRAIDPGSYALCRVELAPEEGWAQ